MFQEPVYEPSKAEKTFEILSLIAQGMSSAFHIPVYLSWGFIGLFSLTLLYVVLVLVESFLRMWRYLLLVLWGVWLIGVAIAIQYAPAITP